MTTTDELRDIGAKHQAARYARMLAVATAAEEKIEALEESLKEAEYFRLLAEYQLDAIRWPEGLGQVFHIGTDEPDEETYALLDIYSGQIWQREKSGGAWYWYRADKAGPTTRYEWPLEETSGPYIRLKDDWHICQLTKVAREADEQKRAIEQELGHKPGYRGEDKWGYPAVSVGVIRAYRALQTEREQTEHELRQANYKIEELERSLEGVREHRDQLIAEREEEANA